MSDSFEELGIVAQPDAPSDRRVQAAVAAALERAAKHVPTRTLTFICDACGFQGSTENGAWQQHIRSLITPEGRAALAEHVEQAVAERTKELGERCERLDVQLAGCSVAALGWSRGEQKANKGDYGYSASYQDVMNLRQKWEQEAERTRELREALSDFAKAIDR